MSVPATATASSVLLRNATTTAASTISSRINTIIFDVDDCMYDVSTGFTAHRNGQIIHKYMVDHLKVESLEKAKEIRDKYFVMYHSTAKSLTVAQQEGELPASAPTFETKHMSQYWVDHLDYSKLWDSDCNDTVENKKLAKKELHDALVKCPAHLVVFSNGPRLYVEKVLRTLGLWDLFGSSHDNNDGTFVFGVDDVLPHCKPEPEAFQKIFDYLSSKSSNNIVVRPEECVMVEDSMKNLRSAKALGMKTVLITGLKEQGRILPCDAPSTTDPSVDISFATIEEMRIKLPGLWNNPPVFEP